ncbi:MAG TPA: lipocalin-like domain-containing protein [Bryobacteraceae bacterium]|jgi:predicted secreted hydrolase
MDRRATDQAAMKSRALLAILVASLSAGTTPEAHWREALPGYHFNFPRDHFDHPDFRTEWWYYTGNVEAAGGERFGFELVFFRQGQQRSDPNPSPWRIDDLYLAHAALTHINARSFVYEERLNRAGPGIAGASFDEHRVWNGNWSAQWNGDTQNLKALTPEFQFSLQLVPSKPPVINGVDGVSQKAEGQGKASYYVSFPRLAASGSITIGKVRYPVKGTAWMDHEWFTHQLQPDQIGWDWFSVQLDDNTELMLFELRRRDGTVDPYSSGTYVDATGKPYHLSARDFRLIPQEKWTHYPIHWKIEVPSEHLQLDCRAAVDNQELKATKGGTTYWEGVVTYSGTRKGVGYLEMTGYDKPVEF